MTTTEVKLKELILANAKEKSVEITDQTNLENDFGYDSLELVQLVTEIEFAFNIFFDVDELDLEKLKSYSWIRDVVASKIVDQSSGV